jgi:hypothetical protein
LKVEIARIQASWSEASGDSPEHLTVDEFLSFEHPEASPTKILAKVQDIFGTFGKTTNHFIYDSLRIAFLHECIL